MFFPIRTDVPLRRTPWMNWLIILLNVLIFAAQVRSGSTITRRFELNPRNPLLQNYIGYAFLHASLMHLLSNMLFLYIFGNNVNDRMGHVGYLGFYLAGAVVSGIAHVAMETQPVIGASGAVFAVTGAFLILFPRSHITVVYFFLLIGVIELASMWFILAYFLLNVFNQFSQSAGGAAGVAYAAHIGGAVFGAAVCLLLLGLRLLPRNQFDVLALASRWNRRRQYRDLIARSGYDPFAYQPSQQMKFNPRDQRVTDLRATVSEAMARGDLVEAVKHFMEMRAIDPTQVLSRQNQLDLANRLFEQQHFAAAADAYENFVRVYAKSTELTHVLLMLGLLYSRYLNRPDRAAPYLRQVVERLHEGTELELAKSELARLAS